MQGTKIGGAAWLLPDGTLKSFKDSSFHEHDLAQNAKAYNEKFGTDFTQGEPNIDDRLAAVNRGFVRFRNDSSGLKVEAPVGRWDSLRSKVQKTLLDNSGDLAKVRISLLDEAGQTVAEDAISLAGVKDRESAVKELISDLDVPSMAPAESKSGPTNVQKSRTLGQSFDIQPVASKRDLFNKARGDFSPKADPIKEAATRTPGGRVFTGSWHVETFDKMIDAIKKGELDDEFPGLTGNDLAERLFANSTQGFVTKSGKFLDRTQALEHGNAIGQLEKNTRKSALSNTHGQLESSEFDGTRRFMPKDEGMLDLGLPSEEELAQQRVSNRLRDYKAKHPEALLPEYQKDDAGNFILQDGKPKAKTVEYGLMDTPLAREAAKGKRGDAREQAVASALGERLVDAAKEAAKDPAIKAGVTWYSTARTRLKKLFGDDSKFFSELLGATSARTPVDTNFRFALDAYNQFKAGDFDAKIKKYREGKAKWDKGDIQDFLDATKAEDPTRGQFLDWWVTKHDLAPTQSNGKKFGANSRAVLRVLDGSWADEVQGPKTPNFAGNLSGSTFEATIDVWAARLLHRLANEGNDKRWRILPESETGVTDADFFLGQAAFRNAAEKLKMKPDALQAILWFFEKDHWEKKGWTRGAGAEKSDFNALLKVTERSPKGKLEIKRANNALELDLGDIQPKGKAMPKVRDIAWEQFGSALDEALVAPRDKEKAPAMTITKLKEMGVKSLDVGSPTRYHDPVSVLVPRTDDSGEFPVSDAGLKAAYKKGRAEEDEAFKLSRKDDDDN